MFSHDTMLFSKDYVGYLAREITKKLIAGEFIESSNERQVRDRLNAALLEELALEDRINDEVRMILETYSDEMRQSGANYQEMFKKVKNLAHAVADTLAEMESVDFIEDRNTIRLEARRILEGLMAEEAKIDAAARQKIESQRRTILEGSQEWDILYRKYYNEEVKKLGI